MRFWKWNLLFEGENCAGLQREGVWLVSIILSIFAGLIFSRFGKDIDTREFRMLFFPFLVLAELGCIDSVVVTWRRRRLTKEIKRGIIPFILYAAFTIFVAKKGKSFLHSLLYALGLVLPMSIVVYVIRQLVLNGIVLVIGADRRNIGD